MRKHAPALIGGISLLAPTPLWAAATILVSVNQPDGSPVENAVAYAIPISGHAPLGKLTAIIDQVDKEFIPYVTAVQTGTRISFPNSDNIRHHVYSLSPAKHFELKLYSGVASPPIRFDKPGVVALGCNIHDWMLAYVLVVDTPWFAVTGKDGQARLSGLDNGEYTLKLWHPDEKNPVADQSLRISSSKDSEVHFQLSVNPRPIRQDDDDG